MRLPLTPILALACLAGLPPAAAAGEIRIPADQPNLEAALAAAAPGDLIRVQTAVDQSPFSGGALVIDKPLTIVGEPVCKLELAGTGPLAGLRLDGPGHGEVVLVGLEIDYLVGFEDGLPSLWGGGFDGLRLYDSAIRHDNDQPTGLITRAYPAVDLSDATALTVVGCDLLGGLRDADTCVWPSFYGDGQAGIYAPLSSVLVIDSTVRGGAGAQGSVTFSLPCPADFTTLPGKGGPGIEAGQAHVWNSTVLGGAGAEVRSDAVGFCWPADEVLCGQHPTAPAYVVSGTLTANGCSRLTQASPRVPLGGTWQVDWDPLTGGCLPDLTACAGCPAFLFVDLAAPTDPFGFLGSWVHLDPATAFLATAFPADLPKTVAVAVPPTPALAGVQVSAQVLLATGELSGPVSGLLLP